MARAIRADAAIKTRVHPVFGQLRVGLDQWQQLFRRLSDQGLTVQQALDLLPATDPQYQPLLDAWPARQTFLQQRGFPGQLQREQALADHLTALLETP